MQEKRIDLKEMMQIAANSFTAVGKECRTPQSRAAINTLEHVILDLFTAVNAMADQLVMENNNGNVEGENFAIVNMGKKNDRKPD